MPGLYPPAPETTPTTRFVISAVAGLQSASLAEHHHCTRLDGLDAGNALLEARRCLSCGSCFSCDNCFGVCPDNAVLKLPETGELNPHYRIDLDFCKGCGICVAECPCGAIEMVPEEV